MKNMFYNLNKLGISFFLTGFFLSIMVFVGLWRSEYDALTQSAISSGREINARLNTAESIAHILSEQMEKNLNHKDVNENSIDIYRDRLNNLWNSYFNTKSVNVSENKMLGTLSGIGDYNKIDIGTKNEINSALNLQINLSGTAYKNTYSWVYYLSKNNFIYIYPRVSPKVYHLSEKSYKGISWKYANHAETQMTEPYLDAAGTGFVVAFISSVYKDNEFKGVVGVEVNLNYIAKLIKEQGVKGNYFVTTKSGMIISSSTPGTVGKNVETFGGVSALKGGLGVSDIIYNRLRVMQRVTISSIIKNISSKFIIFLILNTIFLYALYVVVKYWIGRNEISKDNLLHALKNNQFVPYAQPIISTRTGCIVGCEILIRWLHPIKGIIPPDAFIPLAENSGVIVPITYDLMKKVRDDFSKNLIKLPENFHIAINICPDHLSEESLLEHCQLFMRAVGDKVQLILEITERNNFKFTPHVKEKVSMLLDAGVQFALDDLGTGYSTHSYLQKVRAEYVKIDQSFTQMIGVDEISHHIVNNIVHLAESINIKIIAEGVETIEHATYFKEKDIPYQQGYFYGRPVPLNEFINRVFNSVVIN